MPIGRLQTEADLERFLKGRLERPGFLAQHMIVGLDKFLTLAGRATRGSVTLTGTGTTFALDSVTHGLTDSDGNPRTPEQVLVTTDNGLINASVSSLTDTTFALQNFHINGSNYSDDVVNHWLAVA